MWSCLAFSLASFACSLACFAFARPVAEHPWRLFQHALWLLKPEGPPEFVPCAAEFLVVLVPLVPVPLLHEDGHATKHSQSAHR